MQSVQTWLTNKAGVKVKAVFIFKGVKIWKLVNVKTQKNPNHYSRKTRLTLKADVSNWSCNGWEKKSVAKEAEQTREKFANITEWEQNRFLWTANKDGFKKTQSGQVCEQLISWSIVWRIPYSDPLTCKEIRLIVDLRMDWVQQWEVTRAVTHWKDQGSQSGVNTLSTASREFTLPLIKWMTSVGKKNHWWNAFQKICSVKRNWTRTTMLWSRRRRWMSLQSVSQWTPDATEQYQAPKMELDLWEKERPRLWRQLKQQMKEVVRMDWKVTQPLTRQETLKGSGAAAWHQNGPSCRKRPRCLWTNWWWHWTSLTSLWLIPVEVILDFKQTGLNVSNPRQSGRRSQQTRVLWSGQNQFFVKLWKPRLALETQTGTGVRVTRKNWKLCMKILISLCNSLWTERNISGRENSVETTTISLRKTPLTGEL